MRAAIVMPTFNHDRFLPHAIESVLNQSSPNLRLIVIEDASTDSTPDIVRRYASADARVTAIYHTQNAGIQKAMFEGLSLCTEDVVGFMSDDDILDSRFLERTVSRMQDPEVGGVFTSQALIDSDGSRLSRETEIFNRRYHRAALKQGTHDSPLTLAVQYRAIPIQAFIFRRGLCPSDIADCQSESVTDLWITANIARQAMKLFYEPQELCSYRVHPGQETARRHLRGARGAVWVYRRLLEWPELAAYRLELERCLGESYRVLGLVCLRDGAPHEARRAFISALAHRAEVKKTLIGLTLTSTVTWIPSLQKQISAHLK